MQPLAELQAGGAVPWVVTDTVQHDRFEGVGARDDVKVVPSPVFLGDHLVEAEASRGELWPGTGERVRPHLYHVHPHGKDVHSGGQIRRDFSHFRRHVDHGPRGRCVVPAQERTLGDLRDPQVGNLCPEALAEENVIAGKVAVHDWRSEGVKVSQGLRDIQDDVHIDVKWQDLCPMKQPGQAFLHQLHDNNRKPVSAVREHPKKLHHVGVPYLAHLLALVVEALQDQLRLLVKSLHPRWEHGGL